MTKRVLRGSGAATAAAVLVLGLAACGGDDADPAADQSAETSESPSEEPSDEASDEPTEEPTNDGGNTSVNAPKDADQTEFCDAFDLSLLTRVGQDQDFSALRELQDGMIEVGTPSDMGAKARKGWVWFTQVTENDANSMNQDQVGALAQYYGRTCES